MFDFMEHSCKNNNSNDNRNFFFNTSSNLVFNGIQYILFTSVMFAASGMQWKLQASYRFKSQNKFNVTVAYVSGK